MKIKYYFDAIAELAKIRITISVTFTVLVGYIMQRGRINPEVIFPILGVLLLSCGSSAFNHWQEWKFDKMMDRTKNRPVPSNKFTSRQAFLIASIFTLLGLWVLIEFTNQDSVLLGLGTFILYNLVYTPLKRVTSLAVIPGAFIGSIPPMIGYTAAGGNYLNPDILSIAVFIFVWQMPHFWLLLMIFDEDYKKAGYPTLTQILSLNQLKRITYSWIIALVASGVVIAYFANNNKTALAVGILLIGVILIVKTKYIINLETDFAGYRKAFKSVNYFVLAVILALTLNRLIF